MKPNISLALSGIKDLKTYHYRIILYLDSKGEATQAEMSKYFDTTKQTVNKACKDLISMDIIRVKRTLGKNIFLELNPKPTFEIRGQMKLDKF